MCIRMRSIVWMPREIQWMFASLIIACASMCSVHMSIPLQTCHCPVTKKLSFIVFRSNEWRCNVIFYIFYRTKLKGAPWVSSGSSQHWLDPSLPQTPRMLTPTWERQSLVTHSDTAWTVLSTLAEAQAYHRRRSSWLALKSVKKHSAQCSLHDGKPVAD